MQRWRLGRQDRPAGRQNRLCAARGPGRVWMLAAQKKFVTIVQTLRRKVTNAPGIHVAPDIGSGPRCAEQTQRQRPSA